MAQSSLPGVLCISSIEHRIEKIASWKSLLVKEIFYAAILFSIEMSANDQYRNDGCTTVLFPLVKGKHFNQSHQLNLHLFHFDDGKLNCLPVAVTIAAVLVSMCCHTEDSAVDSGCDALSCHSICWQASRTKCSFLFCSFSLMSVISDWAALIATVFKLKSNPSNYRNHRLIMAEHSAVAIFLLFFYFKSAKT